ncbi:uncharacterized protein [Fopius arisanus]|uniref:Uncharacterized protein n=3 Tax=Fopius arisanus TaxID=64838 RepID=A0A9R1TP28_9HYME|nr:PREDICTED: uncharacterized protein LOC105272218 [Fopius arisanus]
MSRALKKKRKRYPGMPEERTPRQENSLHLAFARWGKIMGSVGGLRLSGGADAVEEVIEKSPRVSGEERREENSSSPPEVIAESSPGSPIPPRESTGDQELDKIFENASEHLREAGKVLARLTGNVEHDLKLMLEDITKKVDNWKGEAQSEVESGMSALEELRKLIISRNNEMQTKLTEVEAAKAIYEKTLADSGVKITIGTDPSYSRLQLPPLQPGGPPGVQMPITPAEIMSRLPPGSQLQADGSVLMPSGAVVPLAAVSSMEIRGPGEFIPGVGPGGFPPGSEPGGFPPGSGPGGFPPGSGPGGFIPGGGPGGFIPGSGPGGFIPGGGPGRFAPGGPPGVFAPGGGPTGFPPGGVTGVLAPGGVSGPFPGGSGPATLGAIPPSGIPLEQLPGYDPQFPTPINTHFSQNQREFELEAEVNRLRRENERIIKESADYENAIQRALLKGVSSLNDEALKVLRNPLECWVPCLPCNSTDESVATSHTAPPKPSKDCWTSQEDKSKAILPSKFNAFCRQMADEKKESARASKKSGLTVCYSPAVKKQSQTSMAWGDNTCIPCTRTSPRPSSGSKSVCLDGKYRKSSSSRDRICPAKGPKSGSSTAGSPRENLRGLNCVELFPASRQDSQEPKRCEPCNRIRRMFDH